MTPPRPLPCHDDPGLQPERTDMAWGRTTLSLVVAAATFLRWLPHHGWFVGSLVAAATLTAITINFTRKRRLHRSIQGINQEAITPVIASTTALAGSVVILSLLGIYTILFLPLNP
ncbi:DUF202 domain-containing protein [Arthrobacter sp. ISL-85]|uniref:DUF202 domain-containing protein n=1 Tax=Arthrobacter sp. ISL-85 TaxID=2819115 RepID=UPI001BED1C6B|nr:DUF202 domain-containing protein [Arthrobacter sp. ISL-85]MBT2568163.1 DUF202 domain-containing protein [Arthrobacter sp. ISL-85]